MILFHDCFYQWRHCVMKRFIFQVHGCFTNAAVFIDDDQQGKFSDLVVFGNAAALAGKHLVSLIVFFEFCDSPFGRIDYVDGHDFQQRTVFGLNFFEVFREKFVQKFGFKFFQVRNLRTAFASIALHELKYNNLSVKIGKRNVFLITYIRQGKIGRRFADGQPGEGRHP